MQPGMPKPWRCRGWPGPARAPLAGLPLPDSLAFSDTEALSDFLCNSDGKAPEASPRCGSVRGRYSGTWIFDQALRCIPGT